MDYHLKQWRNQIQSQNQLHESEAEQYPSAPKMPKLHLDHHHHHHHHNPSSALPLFVPEPKITSNNSLSAYPDGAITKIPRTGSYFSLAQWQELELQALIFRYMMAGAAVPPELLRPINNSLLCSTPYFLNHFQPALLQSGYWGRLAMDPEPGRCRRTDGKKWRCSRDVVAGYKYCERHMHRGRNRSRKPVEIPTHTNTTSTAATVASPPAVVAGGNYFAVSGPSASIDLLPLSQSSSSQSKHVSKNLFEAQNEVTGDERSDGHVLRHFFDDWPRETSNSSHMNSGTGLSIGNSSSDVSLKLSTGVGDEGGEREQRQGNWGTMGGGGPLAEVLRSSPTSVLHRTPAP